MIMHTRKSDEKLLMKFVSEQGWDKIDATHRQALKGAIDRLQKCHEEGLQDYGLRDAVNNEHEMEVA